MKGADGKLQVKGLMPGTLLGVLSVSNCVGVTLYSRITLQENYTSVQALASFFTTNLTSFVTIVIKLVDLWA